MHKKMLDERITLALESNNVSQFTMYLKIKPRMLSDFNKRSEPMN
jgi:hypothetical protein